MNRRYSTLTYLRRYLKWKLTNPVKKLLEIVPGTGYRVNLVNQSISVRLQCANNAFSFSFCLPVAQTGGGDLHVMSSNGKVGECYV